MRKMISYLITLLLMLCCVSFTTLADTPKDDISIGNTIITEENCHDVLGDGTVSYDFDTAVLTLDHANLTETVTCDIPHDRRFIFAGDNDLIILLKGENRIACTDPAELADTYGAWIETYGELTIRAEDGGSLSMVNGGINAKKLTLESGDIIASNTSDIMRAWRFLYCNLYVTGGSFEGFSELGGDVFSLMENTTVDFPAGTLFFEGQDPGSATQVEALTDMAPRKDEFSSMPYIHFICPNALTPTPSPSPAPTPAPTPVPTDTVAPSPLPSATVSAAIDAAESTQGSQQGPWMFAFAASVLINIVLITILIRKKKQ